MIRDLGVVNPGTTIYLPFHTFDSNDPSASVTNTGLAATDIEVYKDGSMTQRASDNGYTLLDTDGIDLDGITGIHGISIDLADNSTAGFWSAGAQYWVVISSITVDAATINFILATFRIGYPNAVINTTIATLASQTSFTLTAGPAEDDALNGCVVLIHDVASAVQKGFAVVSDYTGSTKTVTLLAGVTFTAATTDNVSVFPPSNSSWGGAIAYTATRGLAGTALPAAAADAAGGLIISDAGGLDADAQLVTKINDILTDTGTTLQAEVDGIQADTEDIQARLPAALVNSRMDCTIDGTGMETGAVDNILNRDASGSTTNSTLGAIVNDWENGGRLDLIVDDILVDTAEIGAAGAGLTNINLPNQTMDIVGNITGNLSGSVGSIPSNIKKNQALAAFPFLMTDSTLHAPAAGATVAVTRSIDGGAFGAGTLSAVAEVSAGIYTVDFGAGDLNGKTIILRATATACDDTFERIVTVP